MTNMLYYLTNVLISTTNGAFCYIRRSKSRWQFKNKNHFRAQEFTVFKVC